MKIRNGFVSNSSTSSFICFGWNYELDNEMEKLSLEEETTTKNFSFSAWRWRHDL